MEQSEILQQVKRAVQEIEPTATIYLYGSRARGTPHEESDWDFLILVDGEVTYERKQAIRNSLFGVGISLDEALSSMIYSKSEWQDSSLLKVTPFYQSIMLESIPL